MSGYNRTARLARSSQTGSFSKFTPNVHYGTFDNNDGGGDDDDGDTVRRRAPSTVRRAGTSSSLYRSSNFNDLSRDINTSKEAQDDGDDDDDDYVNRGNVGFLDRLFGHPKTKNAVKTNGSEQLRKPIAQQKVDKAAAPAPAVTVSEENALFYIFYTKSVIVFMETCKLVAEKFHVDSESEFATLLNDALNTKHYQNVKTVLASFLKRCRFTEDSYKDLLLSRMHTVDNIGTPMSFAVSAFRVRFAKNIRIKLEETGSRDNLTPEDAADTATFFKFIDGVINYNNGNNAAEFDEGMFKVVDPCKKFYAEKSDIHFSVINSFYNTLRVLIALDKIAAVDTESSKSTVPKSSSDGSIELLHEITHDHVEMLNATYESTVQQVKYLVDELADGYGESERDLPKLQRVFDVPGRSAIAGIGGGSKTKLSPLAKNGPNGTGHYSPKSTERKSRGGGIEERCYKSDKFDNYYGPTCHDNAEDDWENHPSSGFMAGLEHTSSKPRPGLGAPGRTGHLDKIEMGKALQAESTSAEKERLRKEEYDYYNSLPTGSLAKRSYMLSNGYDYDESELDEYNKVFASKSHYDNFARENFAYNTRNRANKDMDQMAGGCSCSKC